MLRAPARGGARAALDPRRALRHQDRRARPRRARAGRAARAAGDAADARWARSRRCWAGARPERPRGVARLGRWRRGRPPLYGVATFVALSAGAFLPARSPGALDDGGACAVLVRAGGGARRRAAARAHRGGAAAALRRGGGRAGLVGVRRGAFRRAARAADLRDQPRGHRRLARASPCSRASASCCARTRPTRAWWRCSTRAPRALGAPLERDGLRRLDRCALVPGARDSGRDAGLARARTAFPRGLHSARDSRARLDEAALDGSVAYLLDLVARADARKLNAAGATVAHDAASRPRSLAALLLAARCSGVRPQSRALRSGRGAARAGPLAHLPGRSGGAGRCRTPRPRCRRRRRRRPARRQLARRVRRADPRHVARGARAGRARCPGRGAVPDRARPGGRARRSRSSASSRRASRSRSRSGPHDRMLERCRSRGRCSSARGSTPTATRPRVRRATSRAPRAPVSPGASGVEIVLDQSV